LEGKKKRSRNSLILSSVLLIEHKFKELDLQHVFTISGYEPNRHILLLAGLKPAPDKVKMERTLILL
jgi:hypothetical protein